ncbi:hypothetical protein AMTRI_Chr05g63940 [Amborella trichopoda]
MTQTTKLHGYFLQTIRFISCLALQPQNPVRFLRKSWEPDHSTKILSLLETAKTFKSLLQIHAQMIRASLIEDTFLASRIISALCRLSTPQSLKVAYRLFFSQIPHPTMFIWNSIIRAYAHSHEPKEALSLYQTMLEREVSPDNYTLPIVIRACIRLSSPKTGLTIHGQVIKLGFEFDIFVKSGVLNLYINFQRLDVARCMFDEMDERDVVLWTTMIAGYANSDNSKEAFLLFEEMQNTGISPNRVTIVSLLSACAKLGALNKGRWLHKYIEDKWPSPDLLVGNALVNMYAKCGCLYEAKRIFDSMKEKNVVSWNAMIGGFAQANSGTEALALFEEMRLVGPTPNGFTMVSVLSACAQLGDLKLAKKLHSYVEELELIEKDVFVGNGLINMYAKCGAIERANSVFRQMRVRDIFSWTAMITGLVQGNQFKEALSLFQKMQNFGEKPNEVTLVSILSACAQLGALDQGRWIHAYIDEHDMGCDVFVNNALIDMYAKCGCIETALLVFRGMTWRDVASWNTIMGGIAMHGHARKAIQLFTEMLKQRDVRPDRMTLMAVLCACTHGGMVQEGRHYFKSMNTIYGVNPSVEHYGCMVDLLGRAGLFDEACGLIDSMPMNPNAIIWGTLMASCRVHNNVDLAETAARHLIELSPNDEAVYVLLSNMYAESQRWEDARKIRDLMSERGIEKAPGCSSIEVNGVVNEFLVQDFSHPERDRIYSVLDGLALILRQAGYLPDLAQEFDA